MMKDSELIIIFYKKIKFIKKILTFKSHASILIKVAGKYRWHRKNTKWNKHKKSVDKRNKKRYTNKVAKRGSQIKYEPWKLNSRIYNQFTDEKSSKK